MNQLFNKWETPQIPMGAVVKTESNRVGTVRGYYAWEPPIIMYLVSPHDDEGDCFYAHLGELTEVKTT